MKHYSQFTYLMRYEILQINNGYVIIDNQTGYGDVLYHSLEKSLQIFQNRIRRIVVSN